MANENRLISADPIYNGIALYLAENAYLNDTSQSALEMVGKWIREAPTVDAVEVVHGHMVERIVDYEYPSYKVLDCSKCGCSVEKWHNYCPNCGAKMDGERKDNEKETT